MAFTSIGSPTRQMSVTLRDVAVGQLADVDQAVLAGQDLDEGAELLDGGHAALVDPADLDPFGHGLDLVAGGLGARRRRGWRG